MRIGVLTGGGDCPGLNAVIRAAVRKGSFHYEDQFVGFLEGWRGLMENKTMPLDLQSVAGILPRGGTILRTSRTNPAKKPDGLDTCIATLKKNGADALIDWLTEGYRPGADALAAVEAEWRASSPAPKKRRSAAKKSKRVA